MGILRLFQGIVIGVLFFVLLATDAAAWEFNLKGTWIWGYDYVDQSGGAGFFGPHDRATAGLSLNGNPKVNSMNGWVGARTINGVQYGMVTGADASLQWSRIELKPEIRVNSAIRLKGAYQIGASSVTEYGLYANSTSPGGWNPFATGQWTLWWMEALTPWGVLIAGKRDIGWGMGLQYEADHDTTESLCVVAPYGPLKIGLFCYPWRGQAWLNPQAGRDVISNITVAGPQLQPTNIGPQLDTYVTRVGNYRLWDNDRKRQLQPGFFITYDQGNVSIGILYEWYSIHNGPAGAVTNGTLGDDGDQRARTYDSALEDGSVYFKYFNGRCFLNAELAWLRGDIRIQKAANELLPDYTDGRGSRFKPTYTEAWKWASEAGALWGPAKLSLLWSWIPGPDRRRGVWIDRQSWENVLNGSYVPSTHVHLPYSLLIGYQYGAGLLAVNGNGEGHMTDANSFGARLDYAVAANLNVYGTFFYADRVSGGWPWGILTLQADGNGTGRTILLGQSQTPGEGLGALLNAPQNQGPNFAPNIPDNSLGWEITVGADWKLLEGLNMRLRGAYWKVGDWFKFACVDKSVANTWSGPPMQIIVPVSDDGVAIGSGWGINPAKSIAPIWMFQCMMGVDF